MFTIKDKVALVTGAARGIGLDYAKVLLRNKLKAVSLIDINEKNGAKALQEIESEFGKNRAIFLKVDVSDRNQFDEAFETTVQKFKHLDILINNAGIVQEIEWEKCIKINLIGTIIGSSLAMEKYLPKYKTTEEAVILNMSSIAGITPWETTPVYAASKHGVIGYSRSIGTPKHYALSKVRVITICPNGTDTEILQLTKEQQKEPFLSIWLEGVKKSESVRQSSLQLAEHAVKLIESAPSGSAWFISENICKEVIFEAYS